MSVLVIVEYDENGIKQSSLCAVGAALQLGCDDVHILVAGRGCDAVVEECCRISGVSKILVADFECLEHALPENMATMLAGVVSVYSHVFAAATSWGKDFMPRLAGILDVQPVSDIVEVVDSNTFKRMAYAGNAVVTLKSFDVLKVVTVRASAFEPVLPGEGMADIEVVKIEECEDSTLSEFISVDLHDSDMPDLGSAKIVVSGGRGLGSKDNFEAVIMPLAGKLGAAVGATRAAVDDGYISNDHQVGQSGKVVASDLYFAIGISGAAQHVSGIRDSKVIVAINKDEEAPIFKVADYGLVADLFEVVPELVEKL